MRVKIFFIAAFLLFVIGKAQAQLTIEAANFTVQTGAAVSVQGNLTSTKDLPAMGKFLLNGSSAQEVNMGGKSIPNLEIDNSSGINLTGDARISNSLLFTNGKIITGYYNLSLANIASVTGMGTGKFIETDGPGQVFKEITTNLASTEMPIGAGTVYRPIFLTTSGSNSGAKVGVQVLGTISVNSPSMASDYINANWSITESGINGSLSASAKYLTSDISGTEGNLKPYLFNGTDWSSTVGTINTSTNTISFPITIASANITAMDKFDLLKAKMFLQGAYNSSTHLMTDNLRTGGLIPTSDPYSTSTYSGVFARVNDAVGETIDPSILNDQPSQGDNIVDWVFLELRNGHTVLQTRSALVQRDGDIVDVDGKSLVTFNNVSNANYTIAVRHRNHLGLSTDPSTFTPALSEAQSAATLVDFTSSSTSLYGGSSAHGVATDGQYVLWGGNSNLDGKVNYINPNNDKDYILSNILGGSATGNVSGYSVGDLNMNGVVRYTNPNNDKDFLLSTILAGTATKTLTQYLP